MGMGKDKGEEPVMLPKNNGYLSAMDWEKETDQKQMRDLNKVFEKRSEAYSHERSQLKLCVKEANRERILFKNQFQMITKELETSREETDEARKEIYELQSKL